MGGGTTIVEAAAAGRNAIGTDVNQLAQFVTGVKTTPLSGEDIAEVLTWVQNVRLATTDFRDAHLPVESPIRNMPVEAYSFFLVATELAERLRFPRRRRFARCALVRVGQWALDSRQDTPAPSALCQELEERVEVMVAGLDDFVSAARDGGLYKNRITGTRRLIGRSAADPFLVRTLGRRGVSPKLVLTSPPYPGVHVLYHRWQVGGRRETPAPYWIADVRDGHGESYYTMGSRSALGLSNYFAEITAAFRNLAEACTPDTTIVQLISFSNAADQLPQYLAAMERSGLTETSAGGVDSQQIRTVPNRKWYNQRRPMNDASREVLLIHRPTGRETASDRLSANLGPEVFLGHSAEMLDQRQQHWRNRRRRLGHVR